MGGWRFLSIAVLAALSAVLGPLSPASASYPGGAGILNFQDSYSSFDPLNNGTTTENYYLRSVNPTAKGVGTSVTCQGFDGDFSGAGIQFCPQSGAGYAPDGHTMAFSGVQYANDGTPTPDQGGCIVGDFGCPQELALSAPDGSGLRALPVALADAESPEFMPDGQTLIFTGRARRGGARDLYTVKSDGTGLTPLTRDGGTDPAPCANGTVLYVHDRQIYVMSAGGRRRRLTRGGGTLPDCSRDSRTIAFVRASTLYTINVTGRHLRRLSSRHVIDGRPAFSPAGGLIAVTTTRAGGHLYGCTEVTDRLELIDLRGRRRRAYFAGSNQCSSDGDLGGDQLGDSGWQPLPSGAG